MAARKKPATTHFPSVESLVDQLRGLGSEVARAKVARFAIPTERSFGVPTPDVRKLAKSLGRNQELAEALWETGWYDARALAVFIAEPAKITPALMDRWCKDFDNWGTCDAACFQLFDRTPHAFRKVEQWARRKPEFEKRAAFALLAGLAQHAKKLPDDPFLECLPLIEAAATDGRNFVKKGVSWALRGIGERSRVLHAAAVELARKLAASADAPSRWVGNDALRDLMRPMVLKRVASR